MSCFVHSDQTFNRVFWSIAFYKDHAAPIRYCFRHILDAKTFAKKLRDWNVKAYVSRYKVKQKKADYEPSSVCQAFTPIELLKILQSIDYQCIDCLQYQKSSEKGDLEKSVDLLMSLIISDSPEYQAAKWSYN